MNILKSLSQQPFTGFEASAWQFLSFFPDLPKVITEFLAKIAAPLVIIFGFLSLLSIPLSAFDLITTASTLIGTVLLLAAFKPLQQKRHFGITLLFWNSIFQALLGLAMTFSPSIVLGLLLNLYILYQVKPYFTKK